MSRRSSRILFPDFCTELAQCTPLIILKIQPEFSEEVQYHFGGFIWYFMQYSDVYHASITLDMGCTPPNFTLHQPYVYPRYGQEGLPSISAQRRYQIIAKLAIYLVFQSQYSAISPKSHHNPKPQPPRATEPFPNTLYSRALPVAHLRASKTVMGEIHVLQQYAATQFMQNLNPPYDIFRFVHVHGTVRLHAHWKYFSMEYSDKHKV